MIVNIDHLIESLQKLREKNPVGNLAKVSVEDDRALQFFSLTGDAIPYWVMSAAANNHDKALELGYEHPCKEYERIQRLG